MVIDRDFFAIITYLLQSLACSIRIYGTWVD